MLEKIASPYHQKSCYNLSMISIVSVIICVLAMLIQAILQLTPSTFMLFHHYAIGKNSAKKADDLSLNFILGVEIFTVVMWLIVYAVIFALTSWQPDFFGEAFLWVMAGVFAALGVASFLWYFRAGAGTRLFISRKIARNLLGRIKNARTRSDALMLGMVIGVFELIFTLPLYIIVMVELMGVTIYPRILVVLCYTVATMAPLFLIRGAYRAGQNLASIERWRVRQKFAIKILLSASFMTLAVMMVILGVK